MAHVTAVLGVSERQGVSGAVPAPLDGSHKARTRPDTETALIRTAVELAKQYGSSGYWRITALLQADGWQCNHKRVERIWRAEGLFEDQYDRQTVKTAA